MKEEKFYKPKTRKQLFEDTIKFLEETRFNFACFCDCTKKYLERLEKEADGKKTP